MRTYGQYCSVAKALDVVGDRWTFLVVRELLLQGRCRYTDLKRGLPGIATNLLSERLRDLEAQGLVEKEDVPPPVAATLYQLTPVGAELEPVLRALGAWGTRYLTNPEDGDEFRSHWFSFPISLYLRDRDPDGPDVWIALISGDRPAAIEVSAGTVRSHLGFVAEPHLTLRGTPPQILGLLSSHLALDEAVELGLEVTGDLAVLERVRP